MWAALAAALTLLEPTASIDGQPLGDLFACRATVSAGAGLAVPVLVYPTAGLSGGGSRAVDLEPWRRAMDRVDVCALCFDWSGNVGPNACVTLDFRVPRTADLDGSGRVDSADFALFKACFGRPARERWRCDLDGVAPLIDGADLASFKRQFAAQ
jgi:hypothetical protein